MERRTQSLLAQLRKVYRVAMQCACVHAWSSFMHLLLYHILGGKEEASTTSTGTVHYNNVYIHVHNPYMLHTCTVYCVLYCLYMCTLCGCSVKNDFLGEFMKVNPLKFSGYYGML